MATFPLPPDPMYPIEPMRFAKELAERIHALEPQVDIAVEYDEDTRSLFLEPSDPEILYNQRLIDIIVGAMGVLENRGHPFSFGFVDKDDPILHITNPDLVIPALNQAA